MNGKRNCFFELTVGQRMQHIVILVVRKGFQVAPELQYGFRGVVPTHHRSKLSGSKNVVVQTFNQKTCLGLTLNQIVLVENPYIKLNGGHDTSYKIIQLCDSFENW